MNDIFSLAGKTALVTGSSRGIGRTIATTFYAAGAKVVLHGSRASQELEQAGVELGCPCVSGDLGHSEQVHALFAEAVAAAGELDILVLNAALQIRRPWAEISPEEAMQQLQVNLISSLELAQLAAPAMRAKKWGRILIVGSVQQEKPHPDMLVYAASKAALQSMVENLAVQLAPNGITVNNLAPGVILTDRNIDALNDTAYKQKVLSKIPVGFCGESQDCAGAALLLCSEAGRYITGICLMVDGGMSL